MGVYKTLLSWKLQEKIKIKKQVTTGRNNRMRFIKKKGSGVEPKMIPCGINKRGEGNRPFIKIF